MTTTATDNPRGYAYKALTNAWNRQLGWRAFAAAQKYGYYPRLGEYIDQGLGMFDPMYATAKQQDIRTASSIISNIIAEMGRSIKSEMYGHVTQHLDENGYDMYSPRYDVTLSAPIGEHGATILEGQVGEEEQGYTDIEDADLMRMRMRIISQRINDEDFATLQSFVQGDADTLYALFNGDNTKRLLFLRRMKAQLGSLDGALVFG